MNPRQRIKIGFSDFWPGFNPVSNWFEQLLKQRYEVEVCDEPDFLIFSNYGHGYLDYSCPRIFFSAENTAVSRWKCDFIFSSAYDTAPYHHRFPNNRLCYSAKELEKERAWRGIMSENRGFSCVVISNPFGVERNAFWECLEARAPVASGGHYRNNVGGPVPDKREFCNRYKFCLAFENSSAPGYLTEKLFDAWAAGCVPVYWGDERVGDDINTKCFIHARDFDSWESLADHVMEVDHSPALYESYLKQPLLRLRRLPTELTDEAFLNAFARAFHVGHRIPRCIKRAHRFAKEVLRVRRALRGLRPKWYQ